MSHKTGEWRKCANPECKKKDFYAPRWLIKKGGGKFCSMECLWVGRDERNTPPSGFWKKCELEGCNEYLYVPPYRKDTARFHSRRCASIAYAPDREQARLAGLMTHGHTSTDPASGKKQRSLEWKTWMSIKRHCERDIWYRDNNITVCDEWKSDFQEFYKYIIGNLGPRPSPQHSLDRYPDNTAGYKPGNVRWGTAETQGWTKCGKKASTETKEKMFQAHINNSQKGQGGNQKLTLLVIQEIRALETFLSKKPGAYNDKNLLVRRKIAEYYEIDEWHVRDIQKRRCWTHLENKVFEPHVLNSLLNDILLKRCPGNASSYKKPKIERVKRIIKE